ncbi:MAG: amidohydrolase [Rikenellaceae bacterium]|nr:amidohydrolase [Rikenellaceae bacterium]
MKIALCQIDIRWKNPAANMARLEELFDTFEGVDLALLPEMFATGYAVDSGSVAEPEGGEVAQWMSRTAERYDMAVVGSVATAVKGKIYNRMYVALPDGQLLCYDKRHLFTFAGEHNHFSPGAERIVVEWRGAKIMPLVCYDMRFPVWSYLPGEVDVLLYCASWAASRVRAWDALLPARAIENSAYAVGVNRVGSDADGTLFNGHSAAWDYRGACLADAGEGEGAVFAELNIERLHNYRQRFPAWADADKFTLK